MARRDKGLLNDLAFVPWWVSILFGVGFYISLKFIIPSITFGHPVLDTLAKTTAAPQVAWLSVLFLIPAVRSAFNSFRKSKHLDRQSSIDSIRSQSWKEFEELLAEAYRRKGYRVAENTYGGADGGIDLRLERNGNRYLVQCKQWKSSKVGVNIVREMYGVMTHEKADGVIIVSSGMFTEEAKTFASGKPVDLVEGHQLIEMIGSVQSKPSIRSEPARAVGPKVCPQCGKALAVREARRGSNAGNKFWGCSGFPNCRYTASYDG